MGAFVCVCFKKLESRHTHGQFTFCEIIWPAGDCKYLFSAPFTMSSVTIRIGSDNVTLVLVPILTEKVRPSANFQAIENHLPTA